MNTLLNGSTEWMDFLTQLERNAYVLLQHKMSEFADENDQRIGCPWLRWAQPNQSKSPQGILLMQDWGTTPQSARETHQEIDLAISGASNDQTLENLFQVDAWRHAIQNKDWLVSNAVWGFRGQKAPKCGYLTDTLHKRAFSVWGRLVSLLAANRPEDFTLLVAGEWAVFDRKNLITHLPTYLGKWIDWCEIGKNKNLVPTELKIKIRECKGRVEYVSHPCTWGWTGWQKGPLTT